MTASGTTVAPVCRFTAERCARQSGDTARRSIVFALIAISFWAFEGVCNQGIAGTDSLNLLAHLPVPRGTERRLVTEDLVQNGTRVTILSLRSSRSVQPFLQFYRDRWQSAEGAVGSMDSSAGRWQIVSRLEPDYLITVQMQPDLPGGGSRGWLSLTWPFDGAGISSRAFAPGSLMPPAARLVTNQQAEDLSGKSIVRTAMSDLSIDAVADFYLRGEDVDWRAVLVDSTPDVRILKLFQRDAMADAVITRSAGGSVITLTQILSRRPE